MSSASQSSALRLLQVAKRRGAILVTGKGDILRSTKKGTPQFVLKSLLSQNFNNAVPIHPSVETVLDQKCYSSLSEYSKAISAKNKSSSESSSSTNLEGSSSSTVVAADNFKTITEDGGINKPIVVVFNQADVSQAIKEAYILQCFGGIWLQPKIVCPSDVEAQYTFTNIMDFSADLERMGKEVGPQIEDSEQRVNMKHDNRLEIVQNKCIAAESKIYAAKLSRE